MKLMQKLFYICLAVFLVAGAAGCSAFTGGSTSSEKSSQADQINKQGKTLIVYFSQPETNSPDNMTKEEDNSTVVIDGKVLGNTQYVAEVIQKQTNADIARIEPVTPYTTDHKALVDLAKQEKYEDARPAIKDIPNIEQYDTIFVGYPIWWADMPMVMYTFFDKYDLSGKTMIPFSTPGGSGLADTVDAIKKAEPNATVIEDAYSVSRDDVQEAEPEIVGWLKSLGY